MFKKLIVFVIVGILLISGLVLYLQTSSKELYTPQKISLKDLGIGSNASFRALDLYKDKMLIILSFPSRGGIYVYNLTSKEVMNLTANIKGDIGGWGDIYEDLIVWSEERNVERETNGTISVYGIYAYNLTSGEEIPVCIDPTGDQRNPQIYGDIVVWESHKFADEKGAAYLPPNIYGYNLTTKEKFPISTTPAQLPVIYGDIVVWQDYRNGNRDIYGYNLTTKKEFPVCTRDGDQSLVGIWENKILYMEQSSNTTYNIYYYNLTTQKENPIETVSIPFAASSIWENRMVWAEMEESPDKIVKTSMFLYNFTANGKIKIYEKSEPKPEDFGDFFPILYFSIYDDTIAWIGTGVYHYSDGWGAWWSDIYYMKLDENAG